MKGVDELEPLKGIFLSLDEGHRSFLPHCNI
jgi:hypothetical protein